MGTEYAFSCGNNKYYVVQEYGRLLVRRQGWLGPAFIGYARDFAQAMAMMRADAHSGRIVELSPAMANRDAAAGGGASNIVQGQNLAS